MRFLADENFPGPVIRELRARGHDVTSVKETLPGAPDIAVLARAGEESQVVLTFDKDFGELAFRFGLPAEGGVILFRLSGENPDHDNQRALSAIESRDDWPGQFAVVTQRQVRLRPLPSRRG
ncbi:MAG: DUF5615 family PIN-like protein [Planctomycetales bacterium]|nr:DUF5615 family PIN-like protein [Planctomycetales bacterium]